MRKRYQRQWSSVMGISGILFLCTLTAFLLCSRGSFAAGIMTDLGTPGDTESHCWAYGINNAAQVVGSYKNLNDRFPKAFRYSNGTMTDLGTLLGGDSEAFDINDSGQIVGNYFNRALLYSNGTITDLGTLGFWGDAGRDDQDTGATAINNAGQVVGWAYFSGYTRAFLYSNGTMTDLGTLGGGQSSAHGINGVGQVVGTSLVTSDGPWHAFLYSNGTMTDLGTLLGNTDSTATGINDAGQVVGYFAFDRYNDHAFLYSNGTMTDLGTLGGSWSRATAINSAGQVVGDSVAGGVAHPFLYSNGTMTDLGTLGGDSYATGINDAGQVVGYYQTPSQWFRPFLYTPDSGPSLFTDVPSTYWAYAYIMAIYNAGYTTGYGAGTFAPELNVTREQMAAFIIRAKEGEPAANYCSTGSPFPDCATNSWSCRYIKRLYDLGLTTGYGTTGLFMPAYNVSREQMAAFLVRAVEGEPAANYCASGSPFTDVTAANWSCIYIKRLYELGITTGYGNGLYGPYDLVTRAQMAVFLGRAFLGMD